MDLADGRKRVHRFRHWFQAAWFALTNGYAAGFVEGRIYTGKSKVLCVPGLNCYSCPGALASCPIGSLQAVLDSGKFRFSCYMFGILMLFGSVLGRFICGWLCPFGLVQDLLYKIPLPKNIKFLQKKKNMPGHKVLVYLKYVVLLVFVILLPSLVVGITGMGDPWFCKYICPSGTLFGGIPLVATNPMLAAAVGALFNWKMFVLIVIVVLSIKYYRPFCKYLCPLGGIYGLFNPVALYRFQVDKEKCIGCQKCQKVCKMDIPVWKSPNSIECIRCGDCKSACPTGAITSTVDRIKEKRSCSSCAHKKS